MMDRPYRIIIWGAGYEYETVSHAIFSLVEKGQGEVLGIMADSLPPSGTLDGFPILPKDALRDLDFDYLICCVTRDPDGVIAHIVKDYGLPREKIVRTQMMNSSHFDLARYLRLRESNVSIISDLCWGGYLYRTLDLRCMTPFRNLYIEDESYLRLLGDLKGYCSEEPRFLRFGKDDFGKRHPIMALGDVELHFNHAKTPKEALAQWQARVGRINWDNLFAMMWTIDRNSELAFNALEGYDKRICFVPHKTSEPFSLQLYARPLEKHFFDAVNATAMSTVGSYQFDAIKLLLGEPDYLRYVPEEDLHA